jgi:hypothetical protein
MEKRDLGGHFCFAGPRAPEHAATLAPPNRAAISRTPSVRPGLPEPL